MIFLNFTLNFYNDLIYLIANVIIVVGLVLSNTRDKYWHIRYFWLYFLFFGVLCSLFGILGTLFLNINFRIMIYFFEALSIVFLLFVFDSLYLNRLDPWKVVIYLSFTMMGYLIDPPKIAIITTDVGKITSQVEASEFAFIINLIIPFYIFYILIKLFLVCPKSIRYQLWVILGLLFLFTILIPNLVPVILPPSGDRTRIQFFVLTLLNSIMLMLIAKYFIKYRKLFFVLPFTPYRLMVIDTTSGVPIFTHSWGYDKEISNETVLSGMIQGIAQLLKEALKQGDVEKIQLNNALVLLTERKPYNLATIFIISKESYVLKDALDVFTDKFCSKFQTVLKSTRTGKVLDASIIIEDCFSFIAQKE